MVIVVAMELGRLVVKVKGRGRRIRLVVVVFLL